MMCEMETVYIVTWKSENALGFEFNEDTYFDTREEAEKLAAKLTADEGLLYGFQNVSEAFIYISQYLDAHDIVAFPDDASVLEAVYDFFEHITSDKLREKYLYQCISTQFYTYDRRKFMTREVVNLIESNLDNIDVEELLSLAPSVKDKDLASYFGVTPGAVSQYNSTKKELMMLGLKLKNINKPN